MLLTRVLVGDVIRYLQNIFFYYRIELSWTNMNFYFIYQHKYIFVLSL